MQALLGHCTLEALACGWTSPVHEAGILSLVTPYPTRAGFPEGRIRPFLYWYWGVNGIINS